MKNNTPLLPNADAPQGSLPFATRPAYELPEGYFEGLAEDLLTQIHREETAAKWPKTTPYIVPEHYFKDMAEAIGDKAKQIPTQQVPYQVPDDYFDRLSDNIQSQVHQMRTLHLSSHRSWKSLSIAASLLVLLGLAWGMMISGNPNAHSVSSPENQLAALSDVEIDGYIQAHLTEIDRTISFAVPTVQEIESPQWDNELLERSLNAVSDEELKAYSL
jgi:hypothetical protein